ncbi:MAG: nicotinate (nicotinamide) nucleotide adenylyltransferase [Verrucomicrobia bacterium]|jgi:nicotinate-nucleotide adenylyltransferase|nr:nicotinate (nicotinamide) nucleotide adenylyltransferase [Verrucomicrobiota bacterium]|tara:strand:- start:2461 stop:3015 length:555 start_codon:yes stop_codon:yes gene_type:complete
MGKIGIFGGSFDPVHDGHIHLATLAKEKLGLDEVRFLPCQISPHKTETPPTPGDVRAKWLEIALSGIPWAKVDPIELETEGPSYSYQTMRKLHELHPGNQWFWIMGGDQWKVFTSWRNSEVISELAEFIVLARNGEEVQPIEGYRLHVVEGEHPASATKIRRSLAMGEENISFLDPRIATTIQK